MERKSPHTLILPTADKSEDNLCMPLAINVVLKYWGEEPMIEEALERSKQYLAVSGSIIIEGIEIAESHGYRGYIYKGNVPDLRKRIDEGIPVIVIMPGIQQTVQHAMIVIGYSLEEGRIFTYVPEPDSEGAIPEDTFLDHWNQDGFVSIMLIPTELCDRINEAELELRKSYRLCFEAEKSIQKRDFDDAIAILNNAIASDETNSLAWSLLGSIYNDLDSDKAIRYFQKSIDLNPRFYLSYRGIGNYYMKRRNYTQAEKHYSKAINLHGYRFGPIYKNRAIAEINLEDNNAAKEDLLKYLDQCPTAGDRKQVESLLRQI